MLTAGYTLRNWVHQDRAANWESTEGRLIVAWFRLAQWSNDRWGPPGRKFGRFLFLFSSLVFGVEIAVEARIGPGLTIYHPHSIVIPAVTIGARCVVRQSVTIGLKKLEDGRVLTPIVGDDVNFGAHSMILGDLTIGDGAVIGAGAVVTKSVEPRSVVAGNPAKPVQTGRR